VLDGGKAFSLHNIFSSGLERQANNIGNKKDILNPILAKSLTDSYFDSNPFLYFQSITESNLSTNMPLISQRR
jgi:hypothetical protein